MSHDTNQRLVGILFSCGAQVISEELGLKLETTDISMMGRAKKITITKDDTIILDGGGDKSAIGERCDQIREAIAQSQSDYDRSDHCLWEILGAFYLGFSCTWASLV